MTPQELYAILFDVHKHQCSECKTIWEHENISLTGATEEQYHKAHDCPKGCAINQRKRYFGADQ